MSQTSHKPVAMSIAGFDPSGGAGVLADLKTFAAHDCYGVAAVAAVTAQNTREVKKVAPVEPELLRLQIETIFEDIDVAGVKISLLGSEKNLEVAAACLAERRTLPLVADPVLCSAGGNERAPGADLKAFRRSLFPLVRVLALSAKEAGRLLGIAVVSLEEMKGAAKLLHEQGVPHVVITGGHLDRPADVYYEGQEIEVFSGARIGTQKSHGAGCTFSSAILANLVSGKAVRESIVLAKAYVNQAISRAYPIGGGQLPLNHLFRFGEAPARTGAIEVLQEEPRR